MVSLSMWLKSLLEKQKTRGKLIHIKCEQLNEKKERKKETKENYLKQTNKQRIQYNMHIPVHALVATHAQDDIPESRVVGQAIVRLCNLRCGPVGNGAIINRMQIVRVRTVSSLLQVTDHAVRRLRTQRVEQEVGGEVRALCGNHQAALREGGLSDLRRSGVVN